MENRKKFFLYLLSVIFFVGLLLPASFEQEVFASTKATGAKIHFINLNANNDAILLECNGAFGMVDSGEDSSYPNGSNKRYPWRAGIVKGNGQGQNVISYLRSVGVKRLEFYIGTHPHSDHIGNAHQIIKAFRPKRVYLRPYKDSYITNKTRLWDNLYVYDNTLKAIKEVNRSASSAEDGITLIQYFNKNAAYVDPLRKIKDSSNKKTSVNKTYQAEPAYSAPAADSPNTKNQIEESVNEEIPYAIEESEITVSNAEPITSVQTQPGLSWDEAVVDYTPMVPNDTYDAAPLSLTGKSKPQTAKPKFTLGDGMTIEIMNYNEKLSAPDANYFCLGVKVTANGSTAFLSGDINNYRGAEDRLASQLGHVDILKLGHHGYYGSNTTGYLKKLKPSIAILTGTTNQTRQQMWDALASTNTRTYITTLYAGSTGATVINMNKKVSTNIGQTKNLVNKIVCGYSADLKSYIYMKNGKKVSGGGFQRTGSAGYYFPSGSDKPLTNQWYKYKGKWYYFGANGRMKTGWSKLGSYWYYFSKNGSMQTGWISTGGKTYYLTSKGHMVTGDKKIGRYWYHFLSNGSMYTGWLNNRYYYDEQGHWIPSRSKTGWQKYEKGYKWRYQNGTYAKNTWKTIKGAKYYFNSNGYRATGITKIKGKTYYFNSSGKLYTGWKTVNGKKYYFTDKGMYTGFQTIRSKKYYFRSNGALYQKQGLKTISRNIYFFNASHTIATGWKNTNNKRYYFKSNGKAVRGWQTISGKKYYFNTNGSMAVGWKTIGQNRYYFNSEGMTLNGFQTINGSHYLFSQTGILRKAPAPGWYSFNNIDYYYFQTKEAVGTGWLSLQVTDTDGNLRTYQYYLNPQTGILTTGLTELDGYVYYFQPPDAQAQEKAVMDWGMMVTGQRVTITQGNDTLVYDFDENGRGTPAAEETIPADTPTPAVSENTASENEAIHIPEREEDPYAN